jgi:hypothetical protein
VANLSMLPAAAAGRLGLPELLGPACRERDLVYALILSRVLRPQPKPSTLAWWNDVTLGGDLEVAGASHNEVYTAMDWLLARQDSIEATLAASSPVPCPGVLQRDGQPLQYLERRHRADPPPEPPERTRPSHLNHALD